MAYDDYEQSEQVRQWLRENAMAIVAGIVLGLLLIFGAQQWRSHQAKHRAGAADQYQQLQQAVAANKQADIDRIAATLKDQYKDTSFAVFASLRQAELALASEQPDAAITALAWAHQHADSEALKSLISLRTARVELAQGKAQAALTKLDALPPTAYRGMALELRGDALVTLERVAEARKAYTDALSANEADTPQNRLLQLKLDNLAVRGNQDA